MSSQTSYDRGMDALCEAVFDIKKEIGQHTQVVVQGWSMRPLIEFGDSVVIDHSPRKFRPGDVIAYQSGPRIIVHRVLRRREINGRTVYVGKGDSNVKIDPRIPETAILGRVATVIKGNNRRIRLDGGVGGFVGKAFALWTWAARRLPKGISHGPLGMSVRRLAGRMLRLLSSR